MQIDNPHRSDEEEAAIVIESDQSVTRQLVSQNWPVTLKVVVKKKKTSTLKLILMNQLTWPLINFLFLKCKGINKYF